MTMVNRTVTKLQPTVAAPLLVLGPATALRPGGEEDVALVKPPRNHMEARGET